MEDQLCYSHEGVDDSMHAEQEGAAWSNQAASWDNATVLGGTPLPTFPDESEPKVLVQSGATNATDEERVACDSCHVLHNGIIMISNCTQ